MRLFTLFVALSAAAAAQDKTGAIHGKVVDPDGVAVQSVAVRATNTKTGATVSATTGRDGSYTLNALSAGAYDIAVSADTMANFSRKGVAVDASQTVALEIRMQFNTQLGTLGEDRVAFKTNMERHRPPSGPTPRTKDGKPDLSGVWWTPTTIDSGSPQFLPAAEAVAEQRRAVNNKESPQAHCLPSNATRFGPLFQFVQSQDYLIMISDDDSPGFHQVYLDGRGHPADPNPAWYGHNIGHWEGDTLVVDRVGFHERVWLDQPAHPHSEKLHIVERYRRPDLGHLESEVTVDDPGVLAKPYTMKRVADLAQGYEIYEFICPENERDVRHMVGK